MKLISNEITASVGRTMYFFGSSMSGACLAVAIFRTFHPGESTPHLWIGMSAAIATLMFIYGYTINYWCNRVKLSAE
ncbi:exported hypothetical protein [Vibrio nigripulchritudo SFn27]|nr:exported hypothetical protein [Vibrio nigripulchritudo BLFn1]CCN86565.1 exported hypothetical protein [Vibrio nigripulchritudo SFn27]CCN97188.1 exported hypothetical protein [Vibrio nigripulchritudo ENn2]CCO42979.1 exported hypothetical protein [Vibrio nigripulchritudo SFn135]CCO50615.1 exported hypothetical protein [Vibrio nigripulchritudo Wn13]